MKKINNLIQLKNNKQKITCLTGYDYLTANILDSAGLDLILVGDSLANVFAGLSSTNLIGMKEIIYHTEIVARAVKNALIVSDMPFLSYQISLEQSINNAGKLIRAGAEAIKIEGADTLTIELIDKLNIIGIPVIGHLGYTPQSINLKNKGKIQGKTEEAAQLIIKQALSLEQAGAVAIVLELIPSELAKEITQILKIPTIGIGAGIYCDGQILVTDDMLGKTDLNLKFVKKYLNLAEMIKTATENYIKDVKEQRFPSDTQCF